MKSKPIKPMKRVPRKRELRESLVDAALFGAAMVGVYSLAKALSGPKLLPMRSGSWYLVEGTSSTNNTTALRAALLAAGFSDVGSASLPGASTNSAAPSGSVSSRLPSFNPARVSGAAAPSSPVPFAAIARWGGPGFAPAAYPPPIATVVNITAASPADIPPEKMADSLVFDPGTTAREVKAVAVALLTESSPANLENFGRSFLPDAPMTASYLLLMARSRGFALLYQSHLSTVVPATLESAIQAEAARFQKVSASPSTSFAPSNPNPISSVSGIRSPFFASNRPVNVNQPIFGDILAAVDTALGDAIEDTGNALAWANDNLGQYGILIPVVWEGITAYRTLESALVQGHSLEDAWNAGGARTLRNVGHAMRLAAGIVSFWPGLGTIAGIVLNLAAGLALGDDLTGLAIDVIAGAIPGGAIAQAVFIFAANVCMAVIRGETLGQALVDACRAEVRRYCGDEAAIAYDAVVSLARGESIENDLYDVGRGVVVTYAGKDAANAYDAGRAVAQGGGSNASVTQAARILVARYAGEQAAEAFDASVAIAQGKNIEDVALDATRSLLYQYQGAEIAHAFDLAMGLGKAKGLQGAGFRESYTLLRGVDAAQRASDFIEVFSQARAAAHAASAVASSIGVLRQPDGTPYRITTTSGNVNEVLLERVGMTAAWIAEKQTHHLDLLVRPAVAMLLSDTETDPQKMLANLPVAGSVDSIFIPSAQTQAEAEALARRNELPGGAWTGPTLANALLERGLLPPTLLTKEEALAVVEVARACVQELTITELAPGAKQGYDDLAKLGIASAIDPTTGASLTDALHRTRVIVHANIHVMTRVFKTAAEEIPAWAIQAASKSPQGIVQAMQGGSSSYALVSASVISDARTNPELLQTALAYERAQALFLRNEWIHYYEGVSRKSSTVSTLLTSNPGSLESVNTFNIPDDRKIAILKGDQPKTDAELAWFLATFGGPPGNAAPEFRRIQMRDDLHL